MTTDVLCPLCVRVYPDEPGRGLACPGPTYLCKDCLGPLYHVGALAVTCPGALNPTKVDAITVCCCGCHDY